MTGNELAQKLELARRFPDVAHLILSGPSPICELCGRRHAPIVDGRHLGDWCNRPDPVTARRETNRATTDR